MYITLFKNIIYTICKMNEKIYKSRICISCNSTKICCKYLSKDHEYMRIKI